MATERADDGRADDGRADMHSWARPHEVRVRHMTLQLHVVFAAQAIEGDVVLELDRIDRRAPLVLDTRDLAIEDVRISDASESWQPARWSLGATDRLLGTALEIGLAADTTRVRVRYRTGEHASGLQWLAPGQTADGVQPFLYSQSQAIHARSWLPCQDSPGVRTTYDAKVTVDRPVRALMAAEVVPAEEGVHRFRMREPIPAYLVALAVGHVEFAEIGPRTGVWAEPSVLASAKAEFADMDAMLVEIERLYGPYRWGRYDVLVLPPAFPFGGMENPRLTFATPTIIAGDRSLVSLVAHELAHSWSGNLVTNATWEDLWLNEGFTVYIERRILEVLYGRERADMEAVLGRQDLEEALGELAPEDQRLRLQLRGRDPDDALSDVPYEKGALLLRALEETYGRAAFDPFVIAWFERHAFGSVTTEQFEEFLATELLAHHPPLAGRKPVDLKAWLDDAGVPADAPVPHAAAFDRVDAAAAGFVAGKLAIGDLATSTWTTQEWLHFLRKLPRELPDARLADLDRRFALTKSENQEILAQWLEVCVLHGYGHADARLEVFL
ncbi:MAG TPA: leukotriene A4 hydrolase C-terminal domain-containing protein, partial [Nannocystaceae bacterium]|nr:leukotriene A4 hydrolase C-terminal domain-containing protein [Nannocystaceae bacterium]